MARVLFVYKGPESLGIEYLSACLKAREHKTDLLIDPSFDIYLSSEIKGANQEKIMARPVLES